MRLERNLRLSDERGMALVIAVLILLVASGMGIAAIDTSGSEVAFAGTHSRSTATFFAADAGTQVVMNKLNQIVPDTSPVDVTLPDNTNIRTGTRTDTSPQPVRIGGIGLRPPDGYMIGTNGFVTMPYYAELTSRGPSNAVVEVEAKLGRIERR